MSLTDMIDELASYPGNGRTFNQYGYDHELGKHTRQNLFLYLKALSKMNCHTLLVGEAPGYHGCRWTGVPFTSEKVILSHLGFQSLLNQDYYVSPERHAEQTATIVWDVLDQLHIYPLMWNAYPFHPFREDNPMRNRTPTIKELKVGSAFLDELIQLFDIKTIIAVGNKAENTLNGIGITCHKIRHPSHGGKQDFIQGMKTNCV
jgi:Uracil-DNA glycosylase